MANNIANNDDPMWDVFGSDDDDDDNENNDDSNDADKNANGIMPPSSLVNNNCTNNETSIEYNTIANIIANTITKHFLITTKKSSVPLNEHSIAWITTSPSGDDDDDVTLHTVIEKSLHNKQLTNLVSIIPSSSENTNKNNYDACIVSHTTSSSGPSLDLDHANRLLLIGGYLVIMEKNSDEKLKVPIEPQSNVWKYETMDVLYETTTIKVIGIQKWPTVPIQNDMCRWLPSKMNSKEGIINEMNRTCTATVPLSDYEIKNSRMTKQSVDKAVHALQQAGVCIIPGLLRSYISDIELFGQASIQDLQAANTILQQTYNFDIRNPQNTQQSSSSVDDGFNDKR